MNGYRFYGRLLLAMTLVLKITFSNLAVPQTAPKQLTHPADHFVSTQPLGAIYSPAATTFRVFAPTARALQLRLYQSPIGGQATVLEMKANSDGTWETTVSSDCVGFYYTY